MLMTSKYAFQEGLVNLVDMGDGQFGIGVSGLYNGTAIFDPESGYVKFTGDINEDVLVTPELLMEVGVSGTVVKEIYQMVCDGKFIMHKPSEFTE